MHSTQFFQKLQTLAGQTPRKPVVWQLPDQTQMHSYHLTELQLLQQQIYHCGRGLQKGTQLLLQILSSAPVAPHHASSSSPEASRHQPQTGIGLTCQKMHLILEEAVQTLNLPQNLETLVDLDDGTGRRLYRMQQCLELDAQLVVLLEADRAQCRAADRSCQTGNQTPAPSGTRRSCCD